MKMFLRLQKLGIQYKILIYFFSIILISVSLSLLLYSRLTNDYVDKTIYDSKMSEILADNNSFEILVNDVNNFSKQIIASSAIQGNLSNEFYVTSQIKSLDQELAVSTNFNDKISSIYVFDLSGSKYSFERKHYKDIQLEDITGQAWYEDVVNKDGGYVLLANGGGLLDDEEDEYFTLYRLIKSNTDHQPIGVMMVNVDEETILKSMNADISDGTGFLFIDNKYSGVIDLVKHIPINEEIEIDELDGNPQIIERITHDNQVYDLLGYDNETYDWLFLKVKPDEKRTTLQGYFNRIIFVILAINTCLIIVGSIRIGKYITDPIVELTSLMRDVEQGRFRPIETKNRVDEIGQLKSGYNYMIVRIKELIDEVIKEQEMIKDTEMRIILEQIKPHFMYNTLDSIRSLIALNRIDEAGDSLAALSKFYRASLSKGKKEVSFSTELEIVRNYLFIQNIRYQGLFQLNIEVDESLLSLQVPKLMLQPLVENSIYHGLRALGEEGTISIIANRKEEKAVIQVIDDGYGISKEKLEEINSDDHDKSVGIPATRNRIRNMYGNECKLFVTSDKSMTCVTIEIPYDIHKGEAL